MDEDSSKLQQTLRLGFTNLDSILSNRKTASTLLAPSVLQTILEHSTSWRPSFYTETQSYTPGFTQIPSFSREVKFPESQRIFLVPTSLRNPLIPGSARRGAIKTPSGSRILRYDTLEDSHVWRSIAKEHRNA